jgi:hypothetical protein
VTRYAKLSTVGHIDAVEVVLIQLLDSVVLTIFFFIVFICRDSLAKCAKLTAQNAAPNASF